jgi:PAS domain S-box-containing protein
MESGNPNRMASSTSGAFAESYLAAIVESSEDAILSKNLDGIIQSSNAAAERLFGYSSDELIGQSVRILIPPDRQEEEDYILGRIRRGERVDHFETVRVTKDGHLVDISLTVSPVRDPSGTVVGVSKIARDITDRKRAAAALAAQQEALAEQREWFETTLESIGDAVIATDVRGRVVFMNPIAEHLTGWRMEYAQERTCTEVFNVINESTRRTVENPVTRVLQEGVIVGLANHTLLIAADGTERPIDDSGAPIRNREGRIVGVVLVFRDVSERRRTEVEREVSTQDRERLLLAERMARAEAERANRLKDDFVAMISHELRTPLNAILGWTELMLKNRQDPVLAARGLEIVGRNTRVQAQLISDLLDISRIVSGKLRLDIQSVDLASMVDAAIETVQPAADAKDIAIERHLDTTIGPIAGDPARLQQVVWNLLSNALKFTPKNGRVQVTLRRAGSVAEIVVEDHGIGIRPDFLPHVFNRFQQADASRARRFGGLGLGLSIVKNLVEFHGGSVTAQSDGEGKGAVFTITLPLAASPALREASLAPAASMAAITEGLSLAGIRVLVVEDEEDAAELLKRILEDFGADVTTAASAREALDLIATERPDILISDIGLPEMDGYQLMELIRRRETSDGGAIPAVALTAFARSEDRTRALRAGFQAHLSKPFESTELVATVASFVELANAQRARAPDDL